MSRVGRAPLRAVAFTLALGSSRLLEEGVARAAPQMSGALTTGVALTDLRAANAPRVAYHLGGRWDLLLGRDQANRMAFGPYVEVATEAFDTFAAGAGAEWLVPTGDTALILSGGGFGRTSRFGLEPGAEATVFWGSRSYNYGSLYSLGLGLFVQGRYGFGDGQQADVVGGVQVDLEYLALPFVFLYQAVR